MTANHSRPEVRVFIAALRAGKKSSQAFLEYCWAKSVVPIERRIYELRGNPFECPWAWPSMAGAGAADAFDDGKSDAEIAAAFDDDLAYDREHGIVYRTMSKAERPTAGDLIRAMSLDEQVMTTKFFGVEFVAKAVAGGDVRLTPAT